MRNRFKNWLCKKLIHMDIEQLTSLLVSVSIVHRAVEKDKLDGRTRYHYNRVRHLVTAASPEFSRIVWPD